MELMETLRRRRSIRRYKEGRIPEEQLEQILTAALLAPTSMDRKPCRFHVIEDRETLNALSSAKRLGAEMLQGAGAAIVVVADPEKADTWIEDSSIALICMHLAAADLGLGSCWIQIHLRKTKEGEDSEACVRRILGLPEKYRIVGMLSLGLMDKERPPKELKEKDFERIQR